MISTEEVGHTSRIVPEIHVLRALRTTHPIPCACCALSENVVGRTKKGGWSSETSIIDMVLVVQRRDLKRRLGVGLHDSSVSAKNRLKSLTKIRHLTAQETCKGADMRALPDVMLTFRNRL